MSTIFIYSQNGHSLLFYVLFSYRFANREDGETLSLKTFGEHGSWPFKNGGHGSWPMKNGEHSSWPLKNGNVYTSPPDSISLPSNR